MPLYFVALTRTQVGYELSLDLVQVKHYNSSITTSSTHLQLRNIVKYSYTNL